MSSTLQLSLPDGFREILAAQLPSEAPLPSWALEALVIEAYRERMISRGKLGQLLGLSFQEREELLAARGVPYLYDLEDLETDAKALERVLGPIQP